MKNTNSKAFSLIELSIVLIIIGLLVAGVTGGASLIQSAKNRAFINEILEQKQMIFAFTAKVGRYPGDIYDIGKFGVNSGYGAAPYIYSKTDFAPPFDTGSFTPTNYSAPYVELFTEGISDFKPTSANTRCKGYPCSKIIPEVYFYLEYTTTSTSASNSYLYKFRKNAMTLYIYYYGYSTTNNIGLNPKIAKYVDDKIDDGKHNGGNLRFTCWKMVNGTSSSLGITNYDDAIDTKGHCYSGYYDLRLR